MTKHSFSRILTGCTFSRTPGGVLLVCLHFGWTVVCRL